MRSKKVEKTSHTSCNEYGLVRSESDHNMRGAYKTARLDIGCTCMP